MPDREKAIKGLEICTSRPCYCTDCPYKANCCLDSQEVMEDAIVLLKEQEPKRGKWVKQLSSCPSAIAVGGSRTSTCTICGGWGRKAFKYCPHCGAKMEEEDGK